MENVNSLAVAREWAAREHNAQRAKRTALVHNARLLIAHAPLVHYRAQRPMVNERDHMVNILKRFSRHIGIRLDCSEAVSLLYFTSSCRDPNGLDFDGWGNSGQMYHHLDRHYEDPARAHAGALGVYGPNGDEHVVMVIEPDPRDPVVFTHGEETGPHAFRLSTESSFHRGQSFTFLDVSRLL